MTKVLCNNCEWHGDKDTLKVSSEGIETCPACGDNSEGKLMDDEICI